MGNDRRSIILRAAMPTLEEGLVFARYLDEAAEGFFRVMLGRRAADIIATAYTLPGHDLSFENVTFAEADGVVAGMAAGYTAEQHRRSPDEVLERAAGKSASRMRFVKLMTAPLWRIIDTIADDDFYLQAAAVDKGLRGEGIGSILMDHIEEQAVAGGSARLALDVGARNKGARRLYERRGMTIESKWPGASFVPPLLFRMTKIL